MRLVFIFQRSLEIHEKFIQIALWIPSIYIYTATTCRLMLLYVSLIFLIVSVLVFLPVAFSLSSLTHLPSLSLSRFTFYFHVFMCMKKISFDALCSFTHMVIFSRFVFFFWYFKWKKEWEKRSILDLVFHSPIIIAM